MKRPENDSPANSPVRDASEIDDPAGILAGTAPAAGLPAMGRRRIAAPVREENRDAFDDADERAAIQAEGQPSRPTGVGEAVMTALQMRTPRGTPMQSNVIPAGVSFMGSKEDTDPAPVQGAPVETVTVVWPEELYSPIQFHTYKVGPFSTTVNRKPGEAIQEACARAMAQLDAFAKQERMRKHDDYMAHVKLTQSRK